MRATETYGDKELFWSETSLKSEWRHFKSIQLMDFSLWSLQVGAYMSWMTASSNQNVVWNPRLPNLEENMYISVDGNVSIYDLVLMCSSKSLGYRIHMYTKLVS